MNLTLPAQTQSNPTPQWLADALATIKPRHWLLDSVYGRMLLMNRFGQLAPAMSLSCCSEHRELDLILDLLIDDLGLRNWGRPRTIGERCSYLRDITRMLWQVQRGHVE